VARRHAPIRVVQDEREVEQERDELPEEEEQHRERGVRRVLGQHELHRAPSAQPRS
jgi:hypothetical protein